MDQVPRWKWTLPSRILDGFAFEGNTFRIKGYGFDRVTAVGQEMVTSKTFLPGQPGFTAILRSWETIACELASAWKGKIYLTYHFLYTIIGVREALYSVDFLEWYFRYGTGILKEVDLETFRRFRDRSCLERWLNDDSGSYEYKYEKNILYINNRLEKNCYGRAFFVSENGEMGMAPPTARAKDHIVFFPGAELPFVLRPHEDGGFSMIGDCYIWIPDAKSLFREGNKEPEEYLLR
jgi:hypothetical protein